MGSLFLSRTSPWDTSYAFLELTRATGKPSNARFARAKQLLRYLKGRPELNIVYTSDTFDIHAWADENFVQDLEKRKLTGGYLFRLAGAPISWNSALQSLTALTTAGAELVAIRWACRESCHIQDMLYELGFQKLFRNIGNDLTGAISPVTDKSFSARTKHLPGTWVHDQVHRERPHPHLSRSIWTNTGQRLDEKLYESRPSQACGQDSCNTLALVETS